jgi:hypothetical protein
MPHGRGSRAGRVFEGGIRENRAAPSFNGPACARGHATGLHRNRALASAPAFAARKRKDAFPWRAILSQVAENFGPIGAQFTDHPLAIRLFDPILRCNGCHVRARRGRFQRAIRNVLSRQPPIQRASTRNVRIHTDADGARALPCARPRPLCPRC